MVLTSVISEMMVEFHLYDEMPADTTNFLGQSGGASRIPSYRGVSLPITL
jgi:hypothetical protein